MEKFSFFNSVNHDRVYDASDMARFFEKFFTNGVFNNGLLVSANDNMTVSVGSGNANINGYTYENTDTLTLDIEDADSTLSRIDSVVIRLDLINRQIRAMILQGEYSTTPSQPVLVRSKNVYDLRLANVLISANSNRITVDDITDTRFSSECGNVTQAVDYLSTDEIFAQYESWFKNWFSNLQNQLDSNQAGHLQNEINDVNNSINEVNNSILEILGIANDTWGSSNTYSKGDIVVYNNLLFQNKTGNNTTTKPTDDTTNWEQTTILI